MQLTRALHYSVLCVLNALVAPREDVINISNKNSSRCNINNNAVINVNCNDNLSSSLYQRYISPSLSTQVVYRLITANDVVCHNFALSTIEQIHSNWRQQQQQQ